MLIICLVLFVVCGPCTIPYFFVSIFFAFFVVKYGIKGKNSFEIAFIVVYFAGAHNAPY